MNMRTAPGHPGAKSHWFSSRKEGVGRACSFQSRIWFTIGEGILSEIFYPRIDQPCTEAMGMIVTAGENFFSEERVDTESTVHWAKTGVPAFEIINVHRGKRYRIRKKIIADPVGDLIYQMTYFEALVGDVTDYRLYAFLAPHLADEGKHNSACLDNYKGDEMLFAHSETAALGLSCSNGWTARSVGFVGASDGWLDLSKHKRMEWHYDTAKDGNVALTGEVKLNQENACLLTIGFGRDMLEAGQRARAGMVQNFEATWKRYVDEWASWQASITPLDEAEVESRLFRKSAAVLRSHEAAEFPGGMVASLSVPWGSVQEQKHAAGYHVSWARDCSQSALGVLALGDAASSRRTLGYLETVQEADGHWPQAMWIDGSAYWSAIQVDSIAAPAILYETLRAENELSAVDLTQAWPMLRKLGGFICRNGPITEQDRWEQASGFSPYTLALAVAALVIVARAAEENHERDFAAYLRETADAWNAQIESWTYCCGGQLARSLGLPGYFCRIVPASTAGVPQFSKKYALDSELSKEEEAREVVSPDVWGLVRYGLRPAHDPRIVATTQVIDSTLKVETPSGPVWHRFNADGYGETKEGEPFSKVGVGRAWPLLTGERAHYELAAGRPDEAKKLFQALENFAGDSGMLPEQVWDVADMPEKKLFLGRPTGSARPLAWAHSEHVQLLRSLRDQRVFNTPGVVRERYVEQEHCAQYTPWRFTLQTPRLLPGTILRIETEVEAQVRWTLGAELGETVMQKSPIGLYYADLPIGKGTADKIRFTFYWIDAAKWEGQDFEVAI
jgi:glucoamylase